TSLSMSITSSAGYLPSVSELKLPAERGNFCFGQGKLTATPVQITRMTCAIANGGILPEVSLIKGITTDGEMPDEPEMASGKQVLSTETAEKLRLMMIGAVYGSSGFNGRPAGISAGAKTSTAQTGRFDENGVEYCHGWITGFFPANDPEYAVTILAEDGGYGNTAAAPVFKEIAESIAESF
ncbi:MAG: penicillin-binding protein 2, partial [Oscillospiraceae bacterium]|nr:penicillin-binding protein 2 [Oscillospiraceae bacterium]